MAPRKKARATSPDPPIKELIEKRGLHFEREFPCKNKFGFYKKARKLRLLNLIGPKGEGNEKLVRKFYVRVATNLSNEQFIRCKRFLITPVSIRNHYELPEVDKCQYQYYLNHQKEIPLDAISATLTNSKEMWVRPKRGQAYILRKDMIPEARIWLHIVTRNIMPTTHLSKAPRNLALLIYLLMIKATVDIPKLIFDAIWDACRAHNTNLVMPHLISDLLSKAGVEWKDKDRKFKPVSPFNYSNLVPEREQQRITEALFAKQFPDEYRRQQEAQASASVDPTTRSLDLLHEKLDREIRHRRRRQRRMEELLVQIARNLAIDAPDVEDTSTEAEPEEEQEAGTSGAGIGSGDDMAVDPYEEEGAEDPGDEHSEEEED